MRVFSASQKEEERNALELYNAPICWDKPGDAIGYANRSPIYFNWKLFD